jgi:hypothetical protein
MASFASINARESGRSHAIEKVFGSWRPSCTPGDFGALSENASGLFVLERKCTSILPS